MSTSVFTPPPPQAPALRAEIWRLADEVALAGRRLKAALEDKDRLSRMLDTVLENLDAAVVLVGKEGTVVAANGAARRMDLLKELPAGHGGRILDGLLNAGKLGVEEPLYPEGPDGPAWMVRESQVPLPGGETARLLLVQDVTRLVQLEEQARRKSSLEALGRMAAEMAHEVRNPLGSLELFSSMLTADLVDRPEARELAEQILLGVRQLSGTVTRMLTAVRGWKTRRTGVNPATLAREAIAFVQPVADSRGIELVGPSGDEQVEVFLDGEGLRQALLNVLSNALEATPRGGTVALRLRRTGEGLVLEVEDSGPGVPVDLRRRVWEPFFTTRAGGNGLGLALVERIALAHGGRAEIDQGALGGALFRLVLPDAPFPGEEREERR